MSSFFSRIGASVAALVAHAEHLATGAPPGADATGKTAALASTAMAAVQEAEASLTGGLVAMATPMLGVAEQDAEAYLTAQFAKVFGAAAAPALAETFVKAGVQAVLSSGPQVIAQLLGQTPTTGRAPQAA